MTIPTASTSTSTSTPASKSSRAIKAQPPRTRNNAITVVDATPMIQKVDAERQQYRELHSGKRKRSHVDLDATALDKSANSASSSGRGDGTDAAMDAHVAKLLRLGQSNNLSDREQFRKTLLDVSALGAQGMHKRDRKRFARDLLIQQGAEPPQPTFTPYKMAQGMKDKALQRAKKRQEYEREIGLEGKLNVRLPLAINAYQRKKPEGEVPKRDNGLQMKFGVEDRASKGVLKVREREMNIVRNEGAQRHKSLRDTMRKPSTKRHRGRG